MKKWIFVFIIGAISAAAIYFTTAGRNWVKAVFYISHMERDERVSRMHVDRIINNLNILPGHSAADIGAGSGLFTRKIARKAGGGIVYAVDINKKLLDHIEKINQEKGIKNIRTVLASESDPGMPEPVDLIFICDTLHYIKGQAKYIKNLNEYLKPGARIAIVDFKKNWPPQSIQFSREELIKWMKQAGLDLIQEYNYIKDEYLMIFKRNQ